MATLGPDDECPPGLTDAFPDDFADAPIGIMDPQFECFLQCPISIESDNKIVLFPTLAKFEQHLKA